MNKTMTVRDFLRALDVLPISLDSEIKTRLTSVDDDVETPKTMGLVSVKRRSPAMRPTDVELVFKED